MFFNRRAKSLRQGFLCLTAICLVTAETFAQSGTITLAGVGNNLRISVLNAIESIESQSGFLVSYNKNHLDTSREFPLPSTTLPLDELLKRIAEGASMRYIVQGHYIAFVPSNDNSRPQVRNEARTQDSYTPSDPRTLNVVAQPRPVVEPTPAPTPAPVETVVKRETRPYYSDYRSPESYNAILPDRPRFALKTNLLYGAATLTPNIAAEVALTPRSSVELSYSNNPWNYKAEMPSNRKLLHGIVRAGYRYWFCERFGGHFVGVHALYSEYNVSSHDIPPVFDREYRYQGNAWGGGIDYGYALPIGKRWNIEFTAGIGVLRMKYDRYSCLTCDREVEPVTQTWFGPTDLGINLVFLIK